MTQPRSFPVRLGLFIALDKKAQKTTPKPKYKRIRIEDATPEKLQMIMEHSVEGLLMVRDELGGWFGGMDKYSGGGGAGSYDRGFWLKTPRWPSRYRSREAGFGAR
jgi:hypothetical protein